MAVTLQHRRGTESQNNSFTGAVGEITVDTTNKRLRLHDGVKLGGYEVPRKAEVDGIVLYFPTQSMTTLLALDTSIYTYASVIGYATANDGGGGLFNYDATKNKATANAGTIIDPSVSLASQGTGVGLGCWVRQYSGVVNVKWFGAVGNGVVDDTIAIQNTIDSNLGNVYIPTGSYLISSISISDGNKELFGDGENSILLTDKSANIALIIGSTANVENVNISKITIRGNVNNTGGIKIGTTFYAAYILLDEVRVESFTKVGGYGILMERTQELEIRNCKLWANYTGLYRSNTGFTTSTKLTGKKGFIGRSLKYGIHLDGVVDEINITDYIFELNVDGAIYSDGYDNEIIIDTCNFELNSTTGNGTIHVSGNVGIYDYSKVIITRCSFHLGANIALPNISLNRVVGSEVSHNFGLFSNGKISTTIYSQVNFTLNKTSDATSTKAVYKLLLGNISVQDFDISGKYYNLGQIESYYESKVTLQDSLPTVSVPANAGVGATVSLLAGSTDKSGKITVNTGTGASVGYLFTLTFETPQKRLPNIVVCPASKAAATTFSIGQGTVAVNNTTDFGIYFYSAPTSSATYTFQYIVMT